MTEFHINLGRCLAQPYESNYARVRRCLQFNPGLSYETLSHLLRKNGILGGLASHLRELQCISDEWKFTHWEPHWDEAPNQCPECAPRFYHTDLFTYPWITTCPIHHCSLTTTCPTCHQPWPSIKEIRQRNCPGCGIIPLEHFSANMFASIKQQNFQPIRDIFNLLSRSITKEFHIFSIEWPWRENNYRDDDEWWFGIHEGVEYYPSLQAARPPRMSCKKLKSLHLSYYPFKHKSCKFRKDENAALIYKNQKRYNLRVRDQLKQDIFKTKIFELSATYMVMRKITNWIFNNTQHHHILHIRSYRNLFIDDFVRYNPPPCPYCMAISLWFFHTAAEKYGFDVAEIVSNYPFLTHFNYNSFYKGCNPHIRDYHDVYAPSLTITNWFYQRGLLISFIDILYFTFYFFKQIHSIKTTKKYFYPVDYEDIRYFSDQICEVDVNGNKCDFYYLNDDPLAALEPDNIENLSTICPNYHLEAIHDDARNKTTFQPIHSSGLIYKMFLSMNLSFKQHLRELREIQFYL